MLIIDDTLDAPTGWSARNHVMHVTQVVIFKKMLDLCRSNDELAAVIAHEAGHVLARHVVRFCHLVSFCTRNPPDLLSPT